MKTLFVIYLASILSLSASGVDLVVFSYNRPMQLYALLESIEKYVSNIKHLYVLCRSDSAYKEGYRIVQKDFVKAEFIFQDENKQKEYAMFKPLLVDLVLNKERSDSDYCLFAVDDNIVFDYFDLNEHRSFLESHSDIYAFFYRLGQNISKQEYTRRGNPVLPLFNDHNSNILSWKFSEGSMVWHYPNNVDFTLYRKDQIKDAILNIRYNDPNQFEGKWCLVVPKALKGACCRHSKIVNIPMNRVNTSALNKFIGTYTINELNNLFLEGKKLDISFVDSTMVNSVHQNFAFKFIDRVKK
ncbi:MAG: hypothetical protein S4CHLAM20_05660 [Chlamydiia bacterium]|nr:hypothetical protein [Chlamydiia bacterium]